MSLWLMTQAEYMHIFALTPLTVLLPCGVGLVTCGMRAQAILILGATVGRSHIKTAGGERYTSQNRLYVLVHLALPQVNKYSSSSRFSLDADMKRIAVR